MSTSYFKELNKLLDCIEVTDKRDKGIPFNKALKRLINLIEFLDKKKNKIIFIGNGGSASIASHITTDFLKNAGIPAITFSDASLITCLSNDLGYEYVFQKPIEILSGREDILFAISSSGKSKNIVNAALKAKAKDCFVITLSGFNKNNPLRRLGDVNFYVPSFSYGYVEIVHLAICHSIVDVLSGALRPRHSAGKAEPPFAGLPE